ncbi:MAG: hypothetical protein ACLTMP_01915 [Eggerthella lenta]
MPALRSVRTRLTNAVRERSSSRWLRPRSWPVIALGALWRGLEAGMFVDHALMSASHHIQMTMPGSVADVFLY